jgi:hypothetical protein
MLITMIDISFQKCHEVSKRYENQTKICNSLVKLENIQGGTKVSNIGCNFLI